MRQAAAARRCASCERWGGERTPAPPDAVEVAAETTPGLCRGGPWDGSERRARSACGQWLPWPAINPRP